MSFWTFIAAKGEAYSRIDTARFPRFWAEHQTLFSALPDVIHLVGTNGKGSTGRTLALYLKSQGVKTGHYTSPHLRRINERFWIDGADASNEALSHAHDALTAKIPPHWLEELSYFEYTTLIAAQLFMDAGCEAVIWEAGLGGEFDATAVFPARLLLVTPIDYDHQAFLGGTIEAIAQTKLRAMRCPALLAKQHHPSVYAIAENTAANRNFPVERAENLAPKLSAFDAPGSPPYMAVNRQLAFAAAVFLGFNPAAEAFLINPMPGRLSRIAPNVWLDVGHNAAAAREVARGFSEKQVTLVYNSYEDKDFFTILGVLKPVIKKVQIFPVDAQRVAKKEALIAAIESQGLAWEDFNGLDPKENYLVFGSFSVAEAFLRMLDAR